jgi:hypothetical protein
MAFPAVAALIAGAEATAAVVLAAVTEIGVTMTVVGAVTGSKDLMKIGGVMSLVGGIGGMVAGASGAAASTATTGALTEAGTEAALEAASAEAMAGGTVAQDAMTETLLSEMAPAGGIVQGAQAAAPVAQTAAQNIAPQVAQAAPQTAVPQAVVPAATDVAGAQAPMGAQAPIGAQAPAGPGDPGWGLDLGQATNGAPLDSNSFFSKFSAFAEKNKTLMNTGTQLLGGALKGASEADMWDQKMGLERDRQNRANGVGTFAPTTRGIVTGARA